MTRGLDSSLTTAWESTAPTYVRLYELATGTTPATLRWTNYGSAQTFGGNTFAHRKCEHGRQSVGTVDKTTAFDIAVDDLDGTFATIIAAGFDFQGRRLTIHRTIVANLGSGSISHKDVYLVDSWTRKGSQIVFSLKSRLAAFGIKVPREVLTLERFPFIPIEAT